MTRTGKGVGRAWKGGIDSTAESLRACLYQVDRTRMALNEARNTQQAHGPGTVEGQAASYQMQKLHAEVVGWTQCAKEWQEELDDLHAVAAEQAAKAQQKLELRDRAAALVLSAMPPAEPVERPGADDDGDAWEPESAYSELGGAVGGAR